MATNVSVTRVYVNPDHFQGKNNPEYVYSGNTSNTGAGAMWVGSTLNAVGTYGGPTIIIANENFTFDGMDTHMGDTVVALDEATYRFALGSTTTADEWGGIELHGTRLLDGGNFGQITWHNQASSRSDKRVWSVHASRDGSDESGNLHWSVSDTSGTILDSYEMSRLFHSFYTEDIQRMVISADAIYPGTTLDNLLDLGTTTYRFKKVYATGLLIGNVTSHYSSANFVATIGSLTSGQTSALELVGYQPGDGTVSTLSFHNVASTNPDDKIFEIRAQRINDNEAGNIYFTVADSTGNMDDTLLLTDHQMEVLGVNYSLTLGVLGDIPSIAWNYGGSNPKEIKVNTTTGALKISEYSTDIVTFETSLVTFHQPVRIEDLAYVDSGLYPQAVLVDPSGDLFAGDISGVIASGNPQEIPYMNTDSALLEFEYSNNFRFDDNNLFVGIVVAPYNSNTHTVSIGSTTLGETGAIELVGHQTSSATVGQITFHNEASTESNKAIAGIRVERYDVNNAATFAIELAGTTGSMDDVYNVSDYEHIWTIDHISYMRLTKTNLDLLVDVIPLSTGLYDLGGAPVTEVPSSGGSGWSGGWSGYSGSPEQIGYWWRGAYVETYYVGQVENYIDMNSAGEMQFTDAIAGSYTLAQLALGGWVENSAGTGIMVPPILSGVTDVILETGANLYLDDLSTIYITSDSSGNLVLGDGITGPKTLAELGGGYWQEDSAGTEITPISALSGITDVAIELGAKLIFDQGTGDNYILASGAAQLSIYTSGAIAWNITDSASYSYLDVVPSAVQNLGGTDNWWNALYVNTIYIDDVSTYITQESDGSLSFTDAIAGTIKLSDITGGGVTGTGSSGYVAIWDGLSSLTYDADLSFTGTTLTVGGSGTLSKVSLASTADYDWFMEANADVSLSWGYNVTSYLTLTTTLYTVAPAVRLGNLAGTGSRMVIADAEGDLSTQAITTGTVTSVTSGNGMDFTTITATGTVTMGTPSSCTNVTTNATTTTSHTHAVTGFTTAANQSDNRVITATGTADALNAEQYLTFDGSTLTIDSASAASVLSLGNTGTNNWTFTTSGDTSLTIAHSGDTYVSCVSGRIDIGSVTDTTDVRVLPLAGTLVRIVTADAEGDLSSGNLSGQVTTTGSLATALAASAITAQTELTTGLVSTDELMVSDAGVLSRMDISVIQAYMQSNLTFGVGTVTSVASGNGMNFTTITGTGTVTMGTPSTCTNVTTNATTTTSHTHAITGFLTGNQSITLSGDVDGTGTTAITVTIATDAVEGSMLNDNVISGQTELASGLVSTDELMVSDAGVLKRMDISVLETYMEANCAFVTASGTLTDNYVMVGGGTSVVSTADAAVNFNTYGITNVGTIAVNNAGNITVATTKGGDLGTSSLFWDDLYIDAVYVYDTGNYINGTATTLDFYVDSGQTLGMTATATTTYNDIMPAATSTYDLGGPTSQWFQYAYVDRYYVYDATTYITRDGSNNMSFTDAVSGTKTLAQLVATSAIWQVNTNIITPLTSGDDLRLGATEQLQFADASNYMYAGATNTIYTYTAGSLATILTGTYLQMYRTIYPNAETYDLGTSSVFWRYLYVNRIYLDETDDYIANIGDAYEFRIDGAALLVLGVVNSTLDSHFVPGTTDFWTLGNATTFWKYLYTQRVYLDDTSTYIANSGSDITFTSTTAGTVSLANLGTSDVSVANQSNNRVVTATATTDALNAEAYLTFDGSILLIDSASAVSSLQLGNTGTYAWSLSTNGDTSLNLAHYGDVYFNCISGSIELGSASESTNVSVLSNLYNSGMTNVNQSDAVEFNTTSKLLTYYTQTSDIRLKENLVQIEKPMDRLMQCNGYFFNFNQLAQTEFGARPHTQGGMIAQEVEKVFPEVVREYREWTYGGEDTSPAKKIEYPQFVPILVEGLKETYEEITFLRNEVAQLRKQVEILINKFNV